MASLKYEILLLDRNTRFALWQIKMQAVLAQIKTLTSKLHMKQRLHAHCLEEGASVNEHLIMFKESLSNLEAVEVQYDKEDPGLILFCSLPPSYSTFRDTIYIAGKGLIVRERQDRNADDDRGRTKERNPCDKSKGRSKSSNRGKTCNFCKKNRHIKSKCYKLQNKIKREAANKKRKQPKNFGEADVVECYSDGELLVASVNNSKVSEEWIIDLGCTFHMSPNRDWFTTYETVSEERMNRMTMEKVQCMLSNVNLLKSFWAEAASTACFLINRSPSVAIEKKTPQEEEMESLHKNRTWDLVKLPKGKKVVRYKWVFKKKEGTLGVEEPRYKARLVAKGYSQTLGVDFTDVFSPVVKRISIRALLGIVAMHDLELQQLDVKTFGRTRDGVIRYIDANFTGDLDKRRSLTGYVFTNEGCAISWKATLQTTVALSTSEAEYMAITEACKEAIWLKGLLSELNEDLQISTLFCDR
ncbi:hypothetical protein CXB51_003175 [Gossypium anomalum]|uniref:Reverse transcriptase Ty1/copia-type domain-containing protein n=1 Tax=Gossypium anomalum TaxID=47600 RepID=A0A8J6DBG4_9ROSI|nr:hypothetical protein CXB51_003175 [Gossypium anomalum]